MRMRKKTYTDKELVIQLQHGNEQAFDLLYEKYYRLVYFIAYELCKNDADAKDISQETFLQMRKSIHNLQEPDRLKQWINRITINKCKNLFRKHIDMPVEDDILFHKQLKENRFYMLPEKNIHFKSDQECVKYFIQLLSYECREVILLRYYENMSMSEMAEILEIPEGTVKSRLRKAKAELKSLISSYEKVNETPLSFEVNDALLTTALTSSFMEYTSSIAKPSFKESHWNISSLLPNVTTKILVASLACVGVGSSYLAYQSYQEQQLPSLPIQEVNKISDTKAKQYYFKLMDWACCREDMEKKSKAEFHEVREMYQALKNSSSPYYQRLIDENWDADFEELDNS